MYNIIFIIITLISQPATTITPTEIHTPQLLQQVSIKDTINAEIIKGFFDNDTINISKNIPLLK